MRHWRNEGEEASEKPIVPYGGMNFSNRFEIILQGMMYKRAAFPMDSLIIYLQVECNSIDNCSKSSTGMSIGVVRKRECTRGNLSTS